MLRRAYDKTMELAAHRNAPWALAGVSFIESSVFPIPPDVMLIPMVLAERRKAWLFAGIALLGLLGVTSLAAGLDLPGKLHPSQAIPAAGAQRIIVIAAAITWVVPAGEYELFDGTPVLLLPSGRLELKGTTYAAFRQVMEACAANSRAGRESTWISRRILELYTELHGHGFAHVGRRDAARAARPGAPVARRR